MYLLDARLILQSARVESEQGRDLIRSEPFQRKLSEHLLSRMTSRVSF